MGDVSERIFVQMSTKSELTHKGELAACSFLYTILFLLLAKKIDFSKKKSKKPTIFRDLYVQLNWNKFLQMKTFFVPKFFVYKVLKKNEKEGKDKENNQRQSEWESNW